MTREEFEQKVIGKKLIGIYWRNDDGIGIDTESLNASALQLDDGTEIELSGSPQVGVDAVWVDLT